MASLYIVIFTGWLTLAGEYQLLKLDSLRFPCTEELLPILRSRRMRLHVFVTSFKRKNDVIPSNALHDVIFQ